MCTWYVTWPIQGLLKHFKNDILKNIDKSLRLLDNG